MSALLEALRTHSPLPLGIVGSVPQRSLPCPSDSDPGGLSDKASELLSAIDEAEQALDKARQLIEQDCHAAFLAARSQMNDAIGWLQED